MGAKRVLSVEGGGGAAMHWKGGEPPPPGRLAYAQPLSP